MKFHIMDDGELAFEEAVAFIETEAADYRDAAIMAQNAGKHEFAERMHIRACTLRDTASLMRKRFL